MGSVAAKRPDRSEANPTVQVTERIRCKWRACLHSETCRTGRVLSAPEEPLLPRFALVEWLFARRGLELRECVREVTFQVYPPLLLQTPGECNRAGPPFLRLVG